MPELKQITFSLFESIHSRLIRHCKKTGQNVTAVLRQAVFEYLEANPYYTTINSDSIQIKDIYGNVLGDINNVPE